MDKRLAKIKAALKKIEDRNGRLKPDDVVEAARPPTHPLHGEFEWDDSLAGQKWRIQQARMLINSVRVEIQLVDKTINAIAYVRDPAVEDGEQGYRSTVRLSRDADAAHEAVTAEFAMAASHLRRARDLAAALGYADEIEELTERVMDLSERVRSEARA